MLWSFFDSSQLSLSRKSKSIAQQKAVTPSFAGYIILFVEKVFINHVSSRPTRFKSGFRCMFLNRLLSVHFKPVSCNYHFGLLYSAFFEVHVQYKGLERWPTNPFAPTCQVANCNCCTWEFISRAWQSIIFRAKFDSFFQVCCLKKWNRICNNYD